MQLIVAMDDLNCLHLMCGECGWHGVCWVKQILDVVFLSIYNCFFNISLEHGMKNIFFKLLENITWDFFQKRVQNKSAISFVVNEFASSVGRYGSTSNNQSTTMSEPESLTSPESVNS